MIIEQTLYDGTFIHERFAYKYFKKVVSPYGNIVAFRAPMLVTDALIDLEDSMSQDFIYSDDAINFCWEIPNLDPFGAVAFQRLFNTLLGNIFYDYISPFGKMKGDDIMVMVPIDRNCFAWQKASVSITYSKNSTAIGHTGINVKAGDKAPAFAYSSNLTDEECEGFMQEVIKLFNDTVSDIFVATTKVIV